MSVMALAGIYDGAGSWLTRLGIPAMSGARWQASAESSRPGGTGSFSPRPDPPATATAGASPSVGARGTWRCTCRLRPGSARRCRREHVLMDLMADYGATGSACTTLAVKDAPVLAQARLR